MLAGSGYPLESHRRLLELLRDVEGGGRTQCLVRIEVSEAAALPEVTRWTAQGFIQFLARHVRGGLRAVRVTSERPEPDRILFTVHA